jgi:hypothetical protein
MAIDEEAANRNPSGAAEVPRSKYSKYSKSVLATCLRSAEAGKNTTFSWRHPNATAKTHRSNTSTLARWEHGEREPTRVMRLWSVMNRSACDATFSSSSTLLQGNVVTKCLTALLLLVNAALAQEATVTFYSTGSALKAAIRSGVTFGYPGTVPFTGYLFDGDHRLCLIEPGRFMTVTMEAGSHVFSPSSLWKGKHPSEKVRIAVTLEPGKHYFVRLSQNNKGFYVVQIPFQHITEVDCGASRQEASSTEPIKAKRVEIEFRDKLQNVAYFPSCK